MKRHRFEYIIRPGFTDDDDFDTWDVEVWDLETSERLFGLDEYDSFDNCLEFVKGLKRMAEMLEAYTDKSGSILWHNHKDDTP